MLTKSNSRINTVDWISILLYACLVFLGWMSIYGASYDFDQTGGALDFSQRYGKQLVWISFAGFFAVCLLLIDNRIYEYFAYVIYAGSIMLLLATLVLATEIKGSRSWLVLGSISIQPAEFAKFATSLALARYMSNFNYKLYKLRDALFTALIIILPFSIILLQNETGSALVYLALSLVLYREGLPGIFLFLGFWSILLFILIIRYLEIPISAENDASLGILLAYGAIIIVQIMFVLIYEKTDKTSKKLIIGNSILFIFAYLIDLSDKISINYETVALISIITSLVYMFFAFFKFRSKNYLFIGAFLIFSLGYCYSVDFIFDHILQAHHQSRIKVTLGIEDDPSGVGYNVNQSKIAIGSGGFSGKGFLNGTQTKLKYVPEQDTDFIFCTVGEELGFWGSVVVLSLFLALVLRLIFMAERQRSAFSRIYGYCVASILFFHLGINVGMVIGLTPVIGIPLPFFSYGGSSLWGFTILLFIFIRMDMSRLEKL